MFLTTHLLSKIVHIKGVLKANNGKLYNFEFPLDRSENTVKNLAPKIEITWNEFQKSVEELDKDDYKINEFNTSFIYFLESKQKEIAGVGIDEFVKLIPYVLAFIPKIESVQIIDTVKNTNITYKNNYTKLDKYITPIYKIENDITSNLYILEYSGSKCSIACELEKDNDRYFFKSIENLPKLYCDFPLIGTENFYFPIIINSFNFNPLTERNGVWLKTESDDEVVENQEILIEGLELFKKLVKELSEGNFFNFFNISETKIPNVNYLNKDWFESEIQTNLREFLMNSSIIELEDESKKPIKEIWFPSKLYSKDVKMKLWEFNYDLFPHLIPKKDHLIQWSNKSWNEWNTLDYEELMKDIKGKENIEELSKSLANRNTFEWLNAVRKFLLEEESNKLLLNKFAITPNQNGIFKTTSQLFIDKINDKQLIEILKLLKEDWNNILINDNISLGEYQVKEKIHIANQITQKIKNTNERDEDYNKAVILLSEWFDNNNPDEIKSLFSELFRKKAELFLNTIPDKEALYRIMKSDTNLSEIADIIDGNPQLLTIDKTDNQITTLLEEYNLNDFSELKKVLETSKNRAFYPKTELTQEDLAGLGVTSISELEEALKDPDLSGMFHRSSQNVNSFLYAEKLIFRAKKRVIEHLKTLEEYNCDELDEDISKSAIGGIKKNGRQIYIVTRPSDNGFIIVYYGSEKDILDFEDSELWVDNGVDEPKEITLGKILKNTGINKIPLVNES